MIDAEAAIRAERTRVYRGTLIGTLAIWLLAVAVAVWMTSASAAWGRLAVPAVVAAVASAVLLIASWRLRDRVRLGSRWDLPTWLIQLASVPVAVVLGAALAFDDDGDGWANTGGPAAIGAAVPIALLIGWGVYQLYWRAGPHATDLPDAGSYTG